MKKVLIIVLMVLILVAGGIFIYAWQSGKLSGMNDAIGTVGSTPNDISDTRTTVYDQLPFDEVFYQDPAFLEADGFSWIETYNTPTGESYNVNYVIPYDWGVYSIQDVYGTELEQVDYLGTGRTGKEQSYERYPIINEDTYYYIMGTYVDEVGFVHEQGYTELGDVFEIIEDSSTNQMFTGLWLYDEAESKYVFEVKYQSIGGQVTGDKQYSPATLRRLSDTPTTTDPSNSEEETESPEGDGTWSGDMDYPGMDEDEGVDLNLGGRVVTIFGAVVYDNIFRGIRLDEFGNPIDGPGVTEQSEDKTELHEVPPVKSNVRTYKVNDYDIIVDSFVIDMNSTALLTGKIDGKFENNYDPWVSVFGNKAEGTENMGYLDKDLEIQAPSSISHIYDPSSHKFRIELRDVGDNAFWRPLGGTTLIYDTNTYYNNKDAYLAELDNLSDKYPSAKNMSAQELVDFLKDYVLDLTLQQGLMQLSLEDGGTNVPRRVFLRDEENVWLDKETHWDNGVLYSLTSIQSEAITVTATTEEGANVPADITFAINGGEEQKIAFSNTMTLEIPVSVQNDTTLPWIDLKVNNSYWRIFRGVEVPNK